MAKPSPTYDKTNIVGATCGNQFYWQNEWDVFNT